MTTSTRRTPSKKKAARVSGPPAHKVWAEKTGQVFANESECYRAYRKAYTEQYRKLYGMPAHGQMGRANFKATR